MVFEKYEQVLRKETQRLLRIRKKRKRKFTRYMSWRWVKLGDNWRYPRGRDNKARLQLKGRPSLVKIGYRSPRLVRFLHPSGKYEVIVRRLEDLYNIDPLVNVVRISSNVGGRKRLEIIKFAEKIGVRVLNPGKIPEVAPISAPSETEIGELEELTKEIEKEVESIETEELESALEHELEKIEKTEEEKKEPSEEKSSESDVLESELEKELEKIEDFSNQGE
ncbi:MAG: 50S ribosomal protein L32e [Candidatus Njordarchaeota archaeon]